MQRTPEASFSSGAPSRRDLIAPLVIAAGSAATAVSTFAAAPPWNLAGPILMASGVLAAALLQVPALTVAMIPALMPTPQFAKVFAHEVALVVVAAGVILTGLRARRPWTWSLTRLELMTVLLLLWGIATFFWVRDVWWYVFAIRKLGIGLIALWTGWRLASWIRGEDFRLGITVAALLLAFVTLARAAGQGAIDAVGYVSRRDVTDLGWGTSNYIAAILALMVPIALHAGVYERRLVARVLGWASVLLSILVAGVAASRGGALLLVLTIVLFLLRGRLRLRHAPAIGAVVVVLLGLFATPAGVRFAERFTDPQELGSIVVRLMVWREGWNRIVDHFPWGMGLGQGYVQVDRLATEDPHNYWLVVGSELGLVGVVLWAAGLWVTWTTIRRAAQDPARRNLAATLQFTFLIAQLNCLFEPTFSGLHYHFLYFWIIGSSLGTLARSGDQESRPSQPIQA